jgi:uncharacterized protein (DUF2147 family)
MPANDGIGGLWKSIDEKTGKPQCVVAIYNYQGVYYGRIIGTYDDAGRMKETIYNPQGRAPGVVGSPFYCGLDFIWGLKNEGDAKYAGRIMDPEKGSVYHAELWVQNGNLIVRGELLFFGRNQTWLPALKTDFPKGFKFPDTSKFTPTIPHEK